ncbi:hypothetical protein GHT06_016385 [Daphnia sinensis]|uniref:Uncharacterized protein n=1 Tax=Daphnia sinensis TaxID=1820382 RepID=A0AAD5L770_9CRUS|nr:hypothetical protein GHT06_016385 [Daphnia sinensis]
MVQGFKKSLMVHRPPFTLFLHLPHNRGQPGICTKSKMYYVKDRLVPGVVIKILYVFFYQKGLSTSIQLDWVCKLLEKLSSRLVIQGN